MNDRLGGAVMVPGESEGKMAGQRANGFSRRFSCIILAVCLDIILSLMFVILGWNTVVMIIADVVILITGILLNIKDLTGADQDDQSIKK